MKDCIDLLMLYINKHFIDDKMINLLDQAMKEFYDDLSNLYHTDDINDDNVLIDSHHFNFIIVD